MASDKIIVGRDQIVELIPQRYPFVMIDELISSEEKVSVSALEIRTDNIFCIDGLFTEPGLIENIAQTAAARAGYVCKTLNRKPPIGYIGAVKNLVIHFLPAVNKKIYTEIILENMILDVAVVRGIIRCDEKIVAECEMKIFEKKDE